METIKNINFKFYDNKFFTFLTDFRIKVKDFISSLAVSDKIDFFKEYQKYCPFSKYNIYVGFNYKFSVKYYPWSNQYCITSASSSIPFSSDTFDKILTDIYCNFIIRQCESFCIDSNSFLLKR